MTEITIPHEFWMHRALEQARLGEEAGEVPVGAVLVIEDRLIAENFNQPIGSCDPTAHAEILVLREGARWLKNYRLGPKAYLYCTLEPCLMCCGALMQARVGHLIVGARDSRSCSIHREVNLYEGTYLNHRVEVIFGCLQEESENLLSHFFSKKRER